MRTEESGVKVLMKLNEFYSKRREWFTISKLKGSVIVWRFLTPLLTPNVFFFLHQQSVLQHQLGTQQFNPILTLTILNQHWIPCFKAGVSNLLVSLSHTGRRVVLGHTLNTQTVMKVGEQKKGPCIIFVISATTDKKKKSSHNNPNYAAALSIIF